MIPFFNIPLNRRNAVALPLRILILGPLLLLLILGRFLAALGELVETKTNAVGDWISTRLIRCDY